jgi:hypothetical protein
MCLLSTPSCAGFANNAAVAFEVQLQQSFAPLVAMAAMIHLQPYYPALAVRFDEIAAELIAQVSLLLQRWAYVCLQWQAAITRACAGSAGIPQGTACSPTCKRLLALASIAGFLIAGRLWLISIIRPSSTLPLCLLLLQVPVPGAIASLQMSPQGVVHSFFPLQGNEVAMRHNLFKGTDRAAAAAATCDMPRGCAVSARPEAGCGWQQQVPVCAHAHGCAPACSLPSCGQYVLSRCCIVGQLSGHVTPLQSRTTWATSMASAAALLCCVSSPPPPPLLMC